MEAIAPSIMGIGALRAHYFLAPGRFYSTQSEVCVPDQQQHPKEGQLVEHPQWGLGRVLAVSGSKITVYFRDIQSDAPEGAVRTIKTEVVPLLIAAAQADPILDHLPPYRMGKFERPRRK